MYMSPPLIAETLARLAAGLEFERIPATADDLRGITERLSA
jgi:hypothetical protein